MKSEDKKALRAKAHHLEPVLRIGKNGLEKNVIQAIDTALLAHELIKIKVAGEALDLNTVGLICSEQLKCEVIAKIGRVVVLYRKNEE